jgi:hypothetical protein
VIVVKGILAHCDIAAIERGDQRGASVGDAAVRCVAKYAEASGVEWVVGVEQDFVPEPVAGQRLDIVCAPTGHRRQPGNPPLRVTDCTRNIAKFTNE